MFKSDNILTAQLTKGEGRQVNRLRVGGVNQLWGDRDAHEVKMWEKKHTQGAEEVSKKMDVDREGERDWGDLK